MSVVGKIDAGLMSFMTTLRYPKTFKTPLSQFLFAVVFNISMMFLLMLPDLINGKRGITYFIIPFFLLAIFYHWRLWRQLEKQHEQANGKS